MKSSGWTALDIVDEMFKNAKLRVYNEKGGKSQFRKKKSDSINSINIE